MHMYMYMCASLCVYVYTCVSTAAHLETHLLPPLTVIRAAGVCQPLTVGCACMDVSREHVWMCACLCVCVGVRALVCMPAGMSQPDACLHVRRGTLQAFGTCARDVQQLCLHALQLVVGVAVEDFVKLLLDVGRSAEGVGMALLLRHDGGRDLAREPGGEWPVW